MRRAPGGGERRGLRGRAPGRAAHCGVDRVGWHEGGHQARRVPAPDVQSSRSRLLLSPPPQESGVCLSPGAKTLMHPPCPAPPHAVQGSRAEAPIPQPCGTHSPTLLHARQGCLGDLGVPWERPAPQKELVTATAPACHHSHHADGPRSTWKTPTPSRWPHTTMRGGAGSQWALCPGSPRPRTRHPFG